MLRYFFFAFIFFTHALFSEPKIELGVDRLFTDPFVKVLQGKKVGLITNQTGVTRTLESTIHLFLRKQKPYDFTLKALFAPEHGLFGDVYADQKIATSKTIEGIPVYSLYGETRRPTLEMLSEISLFVFDIQDVGCRPYTYATTLFYVMEEAAKAHIPVLVLDRPNPINGLTVDGPMLEQEYRSFIGYVNVPYCHGMTIAELARFFNEQYKVGCDLRVVPMKGWKRWMSFADTGLFWVPTSPYIPEATTTSCYACTGFLGDAELVSIGIGYTLPFKIVGAPWMNAEKFAAHMSRYGLPGVIFRPIRFRPFAGKFTSKPCQGVQIVVTDPHQFLPVTTSFALFSCLKELHPKELEEALTKLESKPTTFFKACGTKKIASLLQEQKEPFAALKSLHTQAKNAFLLVRKKYLIAEYT